MSQIVIFPRGQLNAKDKERLTKAGIVSVEADDPTKVVCVVPGAPMCSTNDLLMSALIGIAGDSSVAERSRMVTELTRRLKAVEGAA